jgi:hypothetical protein
MKSDGTELLAERLVLTAKIASSCVFERRGKYGAACETCRWGSVPGFANPWPVFENRVTDDSLSSSGSMLLYAATVEIVSHMSVLASRSLQLSRKRW